MAEKNSTMGKTTPTKRLAKKVVDEPKPAREVQSAVEQVKPQSETHRAAELEKTLDVIGTSLKDLLEFQKESVQASIKENNRGMNWDLIGFFSVAVTVAGAAIFFWIGWAYEVNWYSYFGVNISQLDLTLQHILIQSIPSLISVIVNNALIVIAYMIVKFMVINVGNRVESKFKSKIAKSVFLQIKSGGILGWADIPLLILIFFNASLITYLNQLLDLRLYSGRGNLPPESVFIILMPIALVYVIFLMTYEKKLVWNIDAGRNWLLLYALCLLMVSVVFSGMAGISDAQNGIQTYTGGWRISKVYLSSSVRMIGIENLIVECDDSGSCLYGPFGLVGENQNSFFLIKWDRNGDEIFQRNPGLYIVSRGDGSTTHFVIVPDSSIILTPLPITTTTISSSTSTVQPTSTATITPTITSTATLIPTASLTPGQP